MKIYFGIDPTGPFLHIGHGSVLLKLKALQKAGNEIIILIGDFTATIGDPTDKISTRPSLTQEQITSNAKDYKKQIGKILDLNKTTFVYNSTWLDKLSFADVLSLSSNFTAQQTLHRDMFKKRMEEGKDLYLNEFLYPLMQAYDSVVLDVDVEIGGNDQMFNMLAGRTLMKKLKNKEKFVITMKLLVDPTGKKMGKTEENMVRLGDEPTDMYGKVMSWPDSLMPLAFEICTEVPAVAVAEVLAGNPRDAKMRLAKEIVSIFSSPEAAFAAEADFIVKFQNKEIPADAPELKAEKGALLRDVLLSAGAVSSNSDFRRLVEGGGIIILPDLKVTNLDQTIKEELTLKVGKKKFYKIIINYPSNSSPNPSTSAS